MNAKICKALRKVARNSTKDKPARRLIYGKNGGHINDPQTTRGAYRFLKRNVATWLPEIKKGAQTNVT